MTDDLAKLTPDLDRLGWDDELEAWSETWSETWSEGLQDQPDGARGEVLARGRIARVSRGFSLVFTGGDAVLAASDATRARTGLAPATGDYVVVEDHPEDGPNIAAIAPRRSALTRRAPGRVPEPQVLAANADDIFVMHGLDRDINIRRIERQLVVSWESGADPLIVLTKADLADDPESSADEIRALAPGVPVVTTSTETSAGLSDIADRLSGGRTVAMMGLSGTGKSSLVNALSEGVVQRTGEVRATDRRGRHTTVARELIPLPNGGFIIDTPGIREIGLWQAYDGLAKTFAEIADEVERCRFTDCLHEQEPGCAVRAALDNGTITEQRLAHWRDLAAELAMQETQLAEFVKRSESRDRADAERRRDQERPNTRRRSKQRRPKRKKR